MLFLTTLVKFVLYVNLSQTSLRIGLGFCVRNSIVFLTKFFIFIYLKN